MQNIADLFYQVGKAIVLVPRGQWMFGSLDEVLGHRWRYSRKQLERHSEKAGLEIAKIVPFNRVFTIP